MTETGPRRETTYRADLVRLPVVPNYYSGIPGAPHYYTYAPIHLIPGSATETCVVFSLPVKADRTTLKICWTPDAAVQLQQPTYCWTFNNDKKGAV